MLGKAQHHGQPFGTQPQMINTDGREFAQACFDGRQFPRVDVQLGVPACVLMDTHGQGLQLVELLRAAALEVEAQGAHACGIQGVQFRIGDAGGQLRDTDEARSQQTQRLKQIALIKTLKGA